MLTALCVSWYWGTTDTTGTYNMLCMHHIFLYCFIPGNQIQFTVKHVLQYTFSTPNIENHF